MAHINPGVAVWLCVVVVAQFSTTMSQELLPQIPASQEDSPLANLWRHALSQQPDTADPTIRDAQSPQTFVAPTYGEVTNWVPQDSAHPLYSTQYQDLLEEILRDYMAQELVKPDDPRMKEPNGLQVTNLNGKTITFKRGPFGLLTVNDVPVTRDTLNADNTATYILTESLFGHRDTVHEAWSAYIQTVPAYDPFGRPLDRPSPAELEPSPPADSPASSQ